jgi:hypothetical protein
MTATTSGACRKRVRSVSSRTSDGGSFSSAATTRASTSPSRRRASPSKTMKRNGTTIL